ncbi:MAG: hypothetical protein JSS30_06605 [Verrucomicrobia bacterium]|nr:hypothetical protein [Verrucomicrobiota bacterium]
MIREDLKDAGEIIQNVLTQPLSIPGVQAHISLLQAAKEYDPRNPLGSDLRKIVLSLLQFPKQTESLLENLEILREEF